MPLQAQFSNEVMSSFYLWMDYSLLNKGDAFFNASGLFYPTRNMVNGYYTYSCPFKPLVSDISISGANIISGVYLNNIFVTTGQSGFADINYNQGELYFTSQLPANTIISGNYAFKQLPIMIVDEPDTKLLFETKYALKPRVGQTLSGLSPEVVTFPIIFIKNENSSNDLFTLDGLENTQFSIRAIIVADSQFVVDATASIFQDRVRTRIPLLTISDAPFNSLGGYEQGVPFNYSTYMTGRVSTDTSLFVENVDFSRFKSRNPTFFNIHNTNTVIFFGFLDFDINFVRRVRF